MNLSDPQYMIKPDVAFEGTVPECEEEFRGFTYAGPGWYKYKEDTILVMPVNREIAYFWNIKSKPRERMIVMVFRKRDPHSFFEEITKGPVRTY